MIKSSDYLSNLPVLDCPDHAIWNTTSEIKANKFIELCFRVNDNYILHTTALVVSDLWFSKVLAKYIQHKSLEQCDRCVLKTNINLQKVICVQTCFHNRVKAHDTMTIGIKCTLPKELRSGDFIAKPFRPFSSYLPLNFMLQFKKRKSYLKIANSTSKGLTIKVGTTLGCVSFELIRDMSVFKHYYTPSPRHGW